jgi:diguanylate cyclase (GGDEF)-like protein/PAS domain S-box-containing protein
MWPAMQIHAEANLEALIESTEDLIWSVDLDLCLLAFNRAFQLNCQKNYGIYAATGMSSGELLPPERAVVWPSYYERALREGPYRSEYELADGRTLGLSFNPIKVNGETTGVSVFGKEITERKAAELALREAERKYRVIFDGALEGIFQSSAEGRVLIANPALARMLGYDSVEEGISKIGDWTQNLWAYPDERKRYLLLLEEHEAVLDFECRFRRKDGSVIWVSLNTRKVCGADGQLLHREGFVTDIDERKRSEEALRESGDFLREAQRIGDLGCYILDFSAGIWTSTSRLDEILGIDASYERSVEGWEALIHPDDLAILSAYFAKEVIGEKKPLDKTYRIVRQSDGAVRWVRGMGKLEFDAEGRPLKMRGIVSDITAHRQREMALRVSENRYRIAFQTSIDAININRLSDGLYIECNQALLDMLGYEREEIIGRTSLELEIWADSNDRHTMVKMLHQNGSCRNMESRIRRKNGEIIWGEMSASLMEIDGVACILTVTRDLSPAKAAEKEIRNLAFYDPLTGLPNRRHLLDKLRQALSSSVGRGRSQALLLIDLDNFKKLNDTLGHQTGDVFLQEIARRIQESVHEADSICRVGGDAFMVMLEDLSEAAEEAAAEAQAVGEKILTLIGRPCMIKERECLSSASIGITIFGDRQCSTDEIMQQTDIALYQAKAAGRNTMRFFAPALQAGVNARATLEEDLRRAIKEKQFMLFYQPQVERGRLVGAEALIRWEHPTRGLVQPDEFIRSAEDTGLILPMGDWVVEAACAQIAAWAGREETAHLTLSVNISALQFRQPEFIEQVLATVERTGADPMNLKLELTESMLVDNFEEVIQKMAELKSHGLSFSLDDFGTGYSSLAYLKLLPLDELKIDRAFVRDMLMDAGSGAIAQAILSLGRAMNLSVIAEGVETKEQRGFLVGLGCHCFQGFLFSRPLPLDEFEQFLRGFAGNSVL